MSYAVVRDVPASWERYEPPPAPVPAGLTLHVAGPTDEGFRTIEPWETREAFERFLSQQPQPPTSASAQRELSILSTVKEENP